MARQIIYHTDPGHGWLQVTRAELEQLGIAGEITSCSYQSGPYVYLEEDCDAETYIKALEAKTGAVLDFVEKFKEQTPIRTYPRYRPT